MSDDLGFIHRFVPAEDQSAGTLLVLHGTGGNENDLVGIGQAIAPRAAILSPRGNVLENGAPRFFRRIAEGVFDPKEVRSRGEELARFIRAAVVTYRLDPTRVFALGYSNGANIAWSLLLKEPGALAGAILLRAMLPFDPRPLPDLSSIPVLLIAAHDDELIPIEGAGLLAALLGEAGANVTYEVLRTGHGLTAEDLKLASEWLAARR